jgi:hypothetical protein
MAGRPHAFPDSATRYLALKGKPVFRGLEKSHRCCAAMMPKPNDMRRRILNQLIQIVTHLRRCAMSGSEG